ncbi:MAG: IS110 family transposase [Bacillota bacterium]
MDVHKETIAVAYVRGGSKPEVWGLIPNKVAVVLKTLRKLGPFDRLHCCYEAGPCGYVLYRKLTEAGISCVVVAPSLIPQKPGDRVKTDRRDAGKLAGLLRSGELSPVWVPGVEHEGLRDLTRARQAARQDLQRHRNRVGKFLLRLGMYPPEGVKSWGRGYWKWLEALQLPTVAQTLVLREQLQAVRRAEELLGRLEAEIERAAREGPLAGTVRELQALRGVKLISAATLVAELGDIGRFRSARELMGYSGLVCSEASSAGRVRRGPLTKTGNATVRWVAVEAAHHYRHLPKVSLDLKRRQEGCSEAAKEIAWKAQGRLNRRYRRLAGRGLPTPKVVAAVARELLGFIWAIARLAAGEGRAEAAVG